MSGGASSGNGGDGQASPASSDPESGPSGTDGLASILSESLFEELFPHRTNPACEGVVYQWADLVEAASRYPDFARTGNEETRRREVAAFLAQVAQETTGGWATAPDGPQAWGLCFAQEVGCAAGACTQYCDPGNTSWPCASGQTYHGRGPIQLSWNYNYGQFGDAVGEDLLSDPDLLLREGVLLWESALWFWMTPQAPKPSCHEVMTGTWTPSEADIAAGRQPGFGLTTNIINGGIECNQPTSDKVEGRVQHYLRFADILGASPGEHLYCDQMQSY